MVSEIQATCQLFHSARDPRPCFELILVLFCPECPTQASRFVLCRTKPLMVQIYGLWLGFLLVTICKSSFSGFQSQVKNQQTALNFVLHHILEQRI